MTIQRTLRYPTDYACPACIENPFETQDTETCTWHGHILVNERENKGIIHGICQKCLIRSQNLPVPDSCYDCRMPFPEGRRVIVISRTGILIRETEAPIDEDRILKKRADFFCHNAQTYILTSVFIGILYAGAMCISLPEIPTIRIEGPIPGTSRVMYFDERGDGSTANLIFFHDMLSVTRLLCLPISACSLGIGAAFTALYLGTSLRRIARPFFH